MAKTRFINGWPFITPGLVMILIIIGWPLLASFYYSFFRLFLYTFNQPRVFVGFNNYIEFMKDPFFLNSLKVTLIYTFITAAISLLIGLTLALLLNNDFVRAKNFFLSIFIIPNIISSAVMGIMWRYFMFAPRTGMINIILYNIFGIEGPEWLIDPKTGMASIIIAAVWMSAPFAFLILYAALTTVPEDLIDAAKIDGASPVAFFIYIVLPYLKPHILFVLLISITANFRQFEKIYTLTGGGPARTTEVLSILVYREGMGEASNMGISNAIAFFMFIVLAIICWLFIKIFSFNKKEK